MADVLVQFDEPRHSADGRSFVAHVCGRRSGDGLWEAWIEFYPSDGGEPARTGIETEQLSRGDLRYWAAGLTPSALDDALERALSQRYQGLSTAAMSYVSNDTLEEVEQFVMESNSLLHTPPSFDPIAVYRQSGEYTLRQELRAMNARQLREIIIGFDIPEVEHADLARTFEDALAERIVAGVQQRVGPARAESLAGHDSNLT